MRTIRRFTTGKTALTLLVAILLVLASGGVTYSQGDVLTQEAPTESLVVTKEQAEFFRLLIEVQDLIRDYHTKDISVDLLYQGAIRGMIDALGDRYSQFFTPEQLNAWLSSLEGEYGGIGVTIELVDGMLMIVGVFSGSPAQEAGLRAGDVIVSVEGHDMKGKLPRDAAVLLRGEPGTPVEAVFLRSSTGEVLNLTIVRATIVQPSMDVKELGDNLHYIRVNEFTEEAGRTFTAIIEVLRNFGMKGLVLDLRDNPGGLVDVCIDMANHLVPKGPIFELGRKELKEVIENTRDVVPVPVVVLVNGGSASASEILAGAIRDRGVGVLVGEKTFGKGCIQTLVDLGDDMGGIKLTIAEYRTPSGQAIEGKGLEPDYLVSSPEIQIPATPEFKRSLRQGMIGLDVLAVQENLAFLGYAVGELDGIFGPKTAAAITAFCREHELDYSGTVTETMMNVLGVNCIQKARDLAGDPIMEKGIEILRNRVQSGTWE
ncbi:MAG: S41 family peptidase [Bacillota bacterium]